MHLGFRFRKADAKNGHKDGCSCAYCQVQKSAAVADNAPPETPWGPLIKEGDLTTSDLEQTGGKLQPEEAPKLKRKSPKETV